jgi:hypothetical protein
MAQIGDIIRKRVRAAGGNDCEPHVREAAYLANARTGYYLSKSKKISLPILLDALEEQHKFPVVGKSFTHILTTEDLKLLPPSTMCIICRSFKNAWKEEEVMIVDIDPERRTIYALCIDPLCESSKEFQAKCKRITKLVLNSAVMAEYRFGTYDVQYIVCPQYILREYLERFERNFRDPDIRRMILIQNLYRDQSRN